MIHKIYDLEYVMYAICQGLICHYEAIVGSWVSVVEFSCTTIHEPQDCMGKGKGISLTPHYHFHPFHRHLDISRAITAESSPLHIGSSRTQTGNLWFPSKLLTTKLRALWYKKLSCERLP